MIPFLKVQSIGNDFVLVDLSVVGDLDLSALALRLSPRRFSVGSDGLLAVARTGANAISMRMFNPDGSEDFCGNGLRCAARYAFDQGWVNGSFVIHHGGREVASHVSAHGDLVNIQTSIGSASFDPDRVPHLHPTEFFETPLEIEGEWIPISSLSTGSTHTIISVQELPETKVFERIGVALEHHPLFPERTSVIWVREDSDTDLRIRIWERGAGETLGCGTGSSAAAAFVARKRGRGGAFQVHNPGGTVQAEMETWDAPITMTGTAQIVFRGEVR